MANLAILQAWLGLPSPGRSPCVRPPPSWQLQRPKRPALTARPTLNGSPHKGIVQFVYLDGLWPLLPHPGGSERSWRFQAKLDDLTVPLSVKHARGAAD